MTGREESQLMGELNIHLTLMCFVEVVIIIIEVVEGDKESAKSEESKNAAKVCVDRSVFPKNCSKFPFVCFVNTIIVFFLQISNRVIEVICTNVRREEIVEEYRN
jgi:hypothetical protein